MAKADFERLTGDRRVNDVAIWLDANASSTEVEQAVRAEADRLTGAVEQFRRLSLREQNGELSELGEELDESLKVANKTEERMREIEKSIGYDRHLRE